MQQTMRSCLLLAAGLVLFGCESEPAEETTELPADTAAAGPTISLADIAGTWNMRYVPESGDTTAVTNSRIEVTPDGWTLYLAGRDPVEGAVTTSGDSILVVEGPYESVRRDGTIVTTHSVHRLEGDRLVGTVVARYPTGAADSVLVLRSEGTRAP
ncbi:hypothetical protein BH20GEM1_BH20GEM1_18330 [soil metagenome]